jgi:Zn-dependent protease
MEQWAAHARALEAHGDYQGARQCWLNCVTLIPPQSQHAEWIRQHVRELESRAIPAQMAQQSGGPKPKSKWARWLGPLAPIALLLSKLKGVLVFLFKFKFLLSFATFIGVYWVALGPRFGIGFAMLIFIHEMGHFIDVKRRGLPADMPVFLPGLGAFVRWRAMGVSLETRAAVSLAGPFAGFLSSALCGLIWYQTHDPLWAALARTGAWLNILNLAPVWVLDGGSAAYALSKVHRAVILVVSVALGYAVGDGVFYLVSAGCLWRLFTRDVPEEPSNGIAAYFLAVLTALALIIWLVPLQALKPQPH